MTASPMVLRTFFADAKVDGLLTRAAVEKRLSKNEYTRQLLQAGIAPFLDGKALPDNLKPGASEDDTESENKVLRSIYLDDDFDDYLRGLAFELRCSKSELMRRFIETGLAAEAQPAAAAATVAAAAALVEPAVKKEPLLIPAMADLPEPQSAVVRWTRDAKGHKHPAKVLVRLKRAKLAQAMKASQAASTKPATSSPAPAASGGKFVLHE